MILVAEMKTRYPLCIKLVIFLSVLVCGISCIICPGVVELGSSTQLTCTNNDAVTRYLSPRSHGDSVATCLSKHGCKIYEVNEGERYSASINSTHSSLTINNVAMSDEGSWSCENVFTSRIMECEIILRKSPACIITSYQNTDNLTIGDEVTLSIHVKDYYCSGPTGIQLQSGHVLEDVAKDQRTDSITTSSFNSTFNVTRSHIGSLKIFHTCNGIPQKILCDGIQGLLEKPHVCIITSDNNRQELDVDENITLIVYVKMYTCPLSTGYELQTGQRREELARRETRLSKNIDEFSSTFTVMKSHFGPVYLFCSNVSMSVSCEGVRVLYKRQHKNNCKDVNKDGVPYATYVGVGVGIGITVIIVVIVLVIVMRTRKKQGLGDIERPSVQGIAGPNMRRQGPEFQGIAGPNMGRQESESQDTINSQPLNNYEDLLPRPGIDYEELRVYNTCH